MVGCFETEMATLCVVHHMEPMEVSLAYVEPLQMSFDDKNKHSFCFFQPCCRSVSVVHECDSQCAIQAEASATATVERRAVSIKKTSFLHNWNNDLYCYNIFMD